MNLIQASVDVITVGFVVVIVITGVITAAVTFTAMFQRITQGL